MGSYRSFACDSPEDLPMKTLEGHKIAPPQGVQNRAPKVLRLLPHRYRAVYLRDKKPNERTQNLRTTTTNQKKEAAKNKTNKQQYIKKYTS